MSADHLPWLSTGSTLSPMIFVLRLANSGASPAMYPNSVVHTGVKSLGWENKTAHPSPIHLWNSIGPWVVSAVKSGAVSLSRMDMDIPLPIAVDVYSSAVTLFHGREVSSERSISVLGMARWPPVDAPFRNR